MKIFRNPAKNLLGAAALALLATALVATSAPAPYANQAELIAALKSAAPAEEKALVCKKLAVCGTKDAVPALAPLLQNNELNSWARIPLEAIPGPEADAALRDALTTVQGRNLVGVINSIGVRRDAQAADALAKYLKDADVQVAAAAAVALGRIGGAQPAKILTDALAAANPAVRSDVAEGCILCAEQFFAARKNADAIKLYDLVRTAQVSKVRIWEATRGAILAREADGLPLLVEQLQSPDKDLFRIGLRAARELPGAKITKAIAALVEKAEPGRQPLIILSLGDRSDPTALPTLQNLAQAGPKPLRLAAIIALDRLADLQGIDVLLRVAADPDADLAQAAQAGLAHLPAKEVDKHLLATLPKAAGKSRQTLIELAGRRAIFEAVPAMMQAATDADAAVRNAAFNAIGVLGDEKQAAALVKILEKTAAAKDQENIEKSLLAIASRSKEKCLPALLPLAEHGAMPLRGVGLHTLASIGGAQALAAVKTALADADTQVQDEAVRTLSTWPNSWPDDAGAAAPLLDLAKNGKKTLHQVLGIRGYLQYLQGERQLKPEAKLAQINELLPLVKRPEEKRLAIAALGTVPVPAAFEQLMKSVAEPNDKEDACSAIANLAAEPGAKKVPKELRKKALQLAIQKTANDATKKNAGKELRALK